jgi:hypothetical protein
VAALRLPFEWLRFACRLRIVRWEITRNDSPGVMDNCLPASSLLLLLLLLV